MNFLKEVHYSEFTTDVSITATTAATANTVLAGSSITYEAVPHLITFSCAYATPDAGAAGRQLLFELYDGTTLGTLCQIQTPAAAANRQQIERSRRLTPTAAAHQYSIRAWVNAGTGTVGATSHLAGFLRIVKIPT